MTTLTVRKGQNLSSLVKQYNATHKNKVSVAQVARQNGVKDANKIQVGQRLRIADGFEASKTKPKPVTTQKTNTQKTNTTSNAARLENQRRVDNSILNVKNQPQPQKRDVFETPAIIKGTKYEYKPQNPFGIK